MSPPGAAAGNARGILAMSAAVVVFIVNDTLIKLAAETLPSAEAIGVRGLFATLWIVLALMASGAWRRLGGIADWRVAARTMLECAGTYTYLLALFHVPISTATAINLSNPLMLTALAVVFLKEDVRWRRWSAVIVGFVGVLLVIQPRPGEFNLWLWVLLSATALNAVRDVVTRLVPASVPSLVVAFATSASVAIVGCAWAVVEGWQPMSGHQLAILLAASVLLAMGYQFVVLAMRLGEISVVGSFRYLSVLWALAIGYFVWGEVPNALATVGIGVIVAAGLYILHREHARAGVS